MEILSGLTAKMISWLDPYIFVNEITVKEQETKLGDNASNIVGLLVPRAMGTGNTKVEDNFL